MEEVGLKSISSWLITIEQFKVSGTWWQARILASEGIKQERWSSYQNSPKELMYFSQFSKIGQKLNSGKL